MSSLERTTFTRNLRGFLGSSWPSRSLPISRLTKTGKSLSADPVEPIDAVFSTISEHYESADHLAGYHSVTTQLLAHDVLDSLIHMQSDMLVLDEDARDAEDFNTKAIQTYRRAQNSFPIENFSVYQDAG